MFDSLTNRLQDVFRQIRGEGRLTEETVELALREIRLALLEADVNFKVVKAFIDRVRDRAVDQEVLQQPDARPAGRSHRARRDAGAVRRCAGRAAAVGERPRVIMLLGLQGSGKTTTSAQAGTLADEAGTPPAAGLDRRAAAGGDRAALGRRANRPGVRVHDPAGELDPVARATGALAEAKNLGFDVVIVDTAGRLHIDDELMDELAGDQGGGRAGRSAATSPTR